MMMMKNKKYSRWVDNDDDDEEQEVLTMGW